MDEVLEPPAGSIYGFTTGVGVRRGVTVAPSQQGDYARRMISDHRVATGDAAPAEVVSAACVRLANGLANGTPGVRPELADLVIATLNQGELPVVRMLGSAGQSDLAPMADLAAGLIREFAPEPGEVHALISNSAFSTALAGLAIFDAERLLDTATVSAALDYEAFAANPAPLAEPSAGNGPTPAWCALSTTCVLHWRAATCGTGRREIITTRCRFAMHRRSWVRPGTCSSSPRSGWRSS